MKQLDNVFVALCVLLATSVWAGSSKEKSKSVKKPPPHELEQFLIQAKANYAEGNYRASRDLCEALLKEDPNYEKAKDCAERAKKQLNKLGKEGNTARQRIKAIENDRPVDLRQ